MGRIGTTLRQTIRPQRARQAATPCQAVDRIHFLQRCAVAGEKLPLVAAWASWELGRIAAALERPRP